MPKTRGVDTAAFVEGGDMWGLCIAAFALYASLQPSIGEVMSGTWKCPWR